jgi:methylmalonyl-CoA mutase N-terminal domain/subunit
VNRFDDGSTAVTAVQPDYQALAEGQRRRLAESRARRDSGAVNKARGALAAAARGTDPLMPRVLDAVRARATLGEIADTLREVWGEYRPG